MKNRARYAGFVFIQIISLILSFCLYPVFLVIWIVAPILEGYFWDYHNWLDAKIVHYDILIEKDKHK